MVKEYWAKVGMPKHVIEFCDGAGSQFKCRDSWAQIADSEQTLGFKVTRHFQESSHGKGPHDGAGANIKSMVAKLNLQTVPCDRWNKKITNAEQFYLCAESSTYPNEPAKLLSRRSVLVAPAVLHAAPTQTNVNLQQERLNDPNRVLNAHCVSVWVPFGRYS